jgi:beta-glucanase (GH16 family)
MIMMISCTEKKAVDETSTEEKSALADQNTYNPGNGWSLTWSDEFNADTINSNFWNYQVEEAGRFNDEWQRYTNSVENAYVQDGALVIKAIHESESHGMDQYTSARLNTANKFTWKYGKIAARIKLPYSEGIWPAFWLLGANINENGGDTPWPQCGEIDILELYGSKDNGVIEANAHYADINNTHSMMGAVAYNLETGKFADDFHVFELEWNENELSWAVDGQKFAAMDITSTEFSEFHKEFFILFNIAVGGSFAGRPNDESIFPQYMYVDWIRVYQML